MSIYNETIEILKEEDIVKELYRFQGGHSQECFNIKTSTFTQEPNKDYVYFSKSLDHHKYFMVKRLKQILRESILKGTDYTITNKDLSDTKRYDEIKHIIINTDKLPNLSSIKLVCDKNYSRLIQENCINNHRKQGSKDLIERVDRRVHGGGYGVSCEWKNLLYYLTYFSASQTIDRRDILKLISNMRQTGRMGRKDNINFLTENYNSYNFKLNPTLESDFTKYKIMECLEDILDKNLAVPTSDLSHHPRDTMRKIVSEYENNKSKILTIMDKHIKM